MVEIGIGRELRFSLGRELLIVFGLLKLHVVDIEVVFSIWRMRAIYIGQNALLRFLNSSLF